MEDGKALDCLAALAHETRLAIMRLLVPQGKTGYCAGEIGRRLGAKASRLSFHLAALEGCGLITSRRESRHVFYCARPEILGGLISYLYTDCACCDPAVGGHCGRMDHARHQSAAAP
ncbi:MAG: ArsR/SmtB family transcription factor [Paracoccaceae bacterium]